MDQPKKSIKETRHQNQRKKLKRVRFGSSRQKGSKQIKKISSYIMRRKRMTNHSKITAEIASVSQQSDGWCNQISSWLNFDSTYLQGYISTICDMFPTLKSIDQLFNLESLNKLHDFVDLRYLQKYSNIVSILNASESKLALLTKGKSRCLSGTIGLKGSISHSRFGMSLSEYESTLIQKRLLFMEKLKNNQSKYDSTLGRMSSISKDLAFCYKLYIQFRGQLQEILRQMTSTIADNFHPQTKIQEYQETYARLLVGKNLRHTFNSTEIDSLNYFKMREHIETQQSSDFSNINSFDQLRRFIEKRKPKRGRKLALHTACSVCFSDYFEMNNPLRSCSTCPLRAHELCYSFKHNRCGSCLYQKLERYVKETVNWCFICRRSGLMTIKLGQLRYAHGFCLLIHGYWDFMDRRIFQSQSQPFLSQEQSSFKLEKSCNNILPSIEFYSPDQNPPPKSSTQIKGPERNWKRKQSSDLDKEKQSENDCLQDFERNLHIIQPEHHLWDQDLFHLEHRSRPSHFEGCKICGQEFFRDLFLSCLHCGMQYHAFCAFLSGFQLKIDEGPFFGGINNLPTLNCCSKENIQLSWNRNFKLNYNRCVFSLQSGQIPTTPVSQTIWEQ